MRTSTSSRSLGIALALVLAASLVGGATPAEARTERQTPVMNSRPALSESEVIAWFESVWRPSYRASVPHRELIGLFAEEGRREGVDWNIALVQAIHETGWFNYPDHGQVRPDDNNFGGLGAYDGTDGQWVFRFPDARTGVRANLHHLRIYGDPHVNATGSNLGSDEIARDIEGRYPPRWVLIRNGSGPSGPYHASAVHWEQFGNGSWATDPYYACKVLNLYRRMLEFNGHPTDGLPTNPTCLRTWHQRLVNAGGSADQLGYLGRDGDAVLACDFNGDGRDTPATFRDGRWTISNAANGSRPFSFNYGRRGDLPLCGDWNGSGQDTVGIVRDGTWHLRNSLSGGGSDLSFTFGRVTRGDIPIVGNWNGRPGDGIGIIRDGQWHLRNRLSGGPGQIVFTYGRILDGDRPLVGDWNGNGVDGIGIARAAEGQWHLRNTLSGGNSQILFTYGRLRRGDVGVVGDWNGNGISTPAIVRE